MTLKSVYGSRENFPEKLKFRKNRLLTNSSPNVTTKFYSTNLFSSYSKAIRKTPRLRERKGRKNLGRSAALRRGRRRRSLARPVRVLLNENLNPEKVAGVPPDYFSADGQLWGNPVYNYAAMKRNGYRWWKSRLRFALSRYDYLRIDHFRGLDRYWAIPNGEKTINGEWEKPTASTYLKIYRITVL